MKLSGYILFSLLFVSFVSAEPKTDGEVVKLFDKGQTIARMKVGALLSCSFDATTEPEVAKWILENKRALGIDIEISQHALVENQDTCAWTERHFRAQVRISAQACRSLVKDRNDAAWILVQQSVHHFGFNEETFPQKVATAISLARITPDCITE